MKQFIGLLLFLVLVVFAVFAIRQSGSLRPTDEGKIAVSASFFTIGDFAKNVGGDLVSVTTLTPAGTEAHNYTPTPREIIDLQSADLFLLNGASFDPWAERLVPDLQKSGVKVRQLSQSINLMEMEEEDAEPFDPHVWLDPMQAREMVEEIRNALIEVDPDNKLQYENNTTGYINLLAELNRSYEHGLVDCQTRNVIVSHDAFGYLGRRYNINFLAVSGLNPDSEPSAKQFGALLTLAEENDIKYVFFETLATPRLVETLAADIDAQILVLNPLEGLTLQEQNAGENYLSIMKENLRNLRVGMECL